MIDHRHALRNSRMVRRIPTAAIAAAVLMVAASSPGFASGGWTIVSSPNYGGSSFNNIFNSVSCFSPTRCMAVGDHIPNAPPNGPVRTLAETWNGSRWSIVATPNPGSVGDYLSGVSCITATSCVAVGTYVAASHPNRPLSC